MCLRRSPGGEGSSSRFFDGGMAPLVVTIEKSMVFFLEFQSLRR